MRVLLDFAKTSVQLGASLTIILACWWLVGAEVTMGSMAFLAATYFAMGTVIFAVWLTVFVIREWRKA
jgi:hypothetical protein